MLLHHRQRPPGETLNEWRHAVELVRGYVGRSGADLERRIEWVGATMPLGPVLVTRSFETWIHADDIRRGAGTTAPTTRAPA